MSDGLDWMDWMDWLSYTAVTPRASLKIDANNNNSLTKPTTGLAHLLEHTIFHASELFPTEGFSQFLR